MRSDNLAEYIRERMEEGLEVTTDDFEGRVCSFCGKTIPFTEWPDNVVTWDIRVQEPGEEPEPYVARYYFCSSSCKSNAMRDKAWHTGEGKHGEDDRIHIDDLEGNR